MIMNEIGIALLDIAIYVCAIYPIKSLLYKIHLKLVHQPQITTTAIIWHLPNQVNFQTNIYQSSTQGSQENYAIAQLKLFCLLFYDSHSEQKINNFQKLMKSYILYSRHSGFVMSRHLYRMRFVCFHSHDSHSLRSYLPPECQQNNHSAQLHDALSLPKVGDKIRV